MEWIKKNVSDNPAVIALGVAGVSVASFVLYKKLYKSQNTTLEYCMHLRKEIDMRFKANKNLQFMPTVEELYESKGMTFTLKRLVSLKDKPVLKEVDFDKKVEKKDDPFAPPLDEALVVTHDLTPKHSLIFNKYPITNNHVLVITKEFEHQKSKLDKEDMGK